MLTNLIANSITHGSDPTKVALFGERDDVVIVVTNHGPAIPKEMLASLFQPFDRPRASDDFAPNNGLGLGLYIVSEIVFSHGGTLSVASADDLTTFTINLPRLG